MNSRTGRSESGRRWWPGSSHPKGRCGVLGVIALALAALAVGAVPCSAAGLVIEAPNLTATPGSSGSFDLLLMNTNTTGPGYQVAADQFVLSLSGPLGISFTSVSIVTDPVTAPYIFVTPGNPMLSGDTFPNSSFSAFDIELASPGYQTVDLGKTFGLAHVSYTVSSSTPIGIDTITIAPPPTSVLSDPFGNPISFGISNGTIAVGVAIPEPWALTQAGTAVLVGLGLAWKRRQKK